MKIFITRFFLISFFIVKAHKSEQATKFGRLLNCYNCFVIMIIIRLYHHFILFQQMDFYVVLFGDYVATVHESWINFKEKIVHWPNKKLTNKLRRELPSEEWSKIPLEKCEGPYGWSFCITFSISSFF